MWSLVSGKGKAIRLGGALLVVGALLGLSKWSTLRAQADEDTFVVRPYVQLGNHPTYTKTDSEELLWVSTNNTAKWAVERSDSEKGKWHQCGPVSSKTITCSADAKDFLFECDLSNLTAGKVFYYRVLQNGKVVFEANSQARRGQNEAYTFAVFGDCGAGTPGQRKVALQCFNAKPDFLVIPGDIVYSFGLYKEYLKNFFPIINAEKASLDGVPLMSHVLTFGVLGNHDIALTRESNKTDLTKFPDALAYYFLWSEPLNGPKHDTGNTPLGGTEDEQKKFKELAGKNFPNMGNYSFDYGNSHWLVLDGNHYTKWEDPEWRKWVEEDLAKAQSKTWRFVTFHQPGFSADAQHYNEQRMRLLSDIFQKENVDIVFAGHAHDYQRTFPLEYTPTLKNGLPQLNADGTVIGEEPVLDKKFDGVKNTKPKGIIYVVTGAGGAKLYGEYPGQSTAPQKSFIYTFDGNAHSYSLCNVKGSTFKMKQITGDGKLVDEFTVEKNHQAL